MTACEDLHHPNLRTLLVSVVVSGQAPIQPTGLVITLEATPRRGAELVSHLL